MGMHKQHSVWKELLTSNQLNVIRNEARHHYSPITDACLLSCGGELNSQSMAGILKNVIIIKFIFMAKYSKKAQDKVEKAMHERKQGTLKSGRSGKKVTSKKQAIAIGLSEARKKGAKVPKKKSK